MSRISQLIPIASLQEITLWLRSWREDRLNLSQEEALDLIAELFPDETPSLRSLSRWETGVEPIPPAAFKTIARAYIGKDRGGLPAAEEVDEIWLNFFPAPEVPASPPEPFYREMGPWLASRRKARLGLSPADALRLVENWFPGKSPSKRSLTRWETGEDSIPHECFKMLAAAYIAKERGKLPPAEDLEKLWRVFLPAPKAPAAPPEPVRVDRVIPHPAAPRAFRRKSEAFLEMEHFFPHAWKFAGGSKQLAGAHRLWQSWPETYNRQDHLLSLPWQKGVLKIPSVVCVQSTERNPLSVKYQPINTPFSLTGPVTDRTDGIEFSNVRENLDIARLVELDRKGSFIDAAVQPIKYMDSLRSNNAYDYPNGKNRQTLRAWLDQPDHCLHPLKKSPLANPIGTNTLVFDRNGWLVLTIRSDKCVSRPYQLVSGSSGTMDWLNVDPFFETNRELALSCEDIDGGIKFLGIARELSRGGLPDFFYAVHVKLSLKEIDAKRIKAAEEFEIKRLAFYDGFGDLSRGVGTPKARGDFEKVFRQLTQDIVSKASIPLLVNLALWRRFILNIE